MKVGIKILWILLVTWPVAAIAFFWLSSFPVAMLELLVFGLEGGPASDVINWAYNQRLWWCGPGAGIAGEVGAPLLAMGVVAFVGVRAKRERRTARRDIIVIAVCSIVVLLALAAYCFALRESGGELPAMRYAGSWFRIENIVGEPELDRSPQMTLHAVSRLAAALATPIVFSALGSRSRSVDEKPGKPSAAM